MQQSLHVMRLSEAELAAMYGLDSSKAGHVQVCKQCCWWQLGMFCDGWARSLYVHLVHHWVVIATDCMVCWQVYHVCAWSSD
jgi:hypothetical protein